MALLEADAARAVAVNGEPDKHRGSGRGLRGGDMRAGAEGWLGCWMLLLIAAAACSLLAAALPFAAHLSISARRARSSAVLAEAGARCLRVYLCVCVFACVYVRVHMGFQLS